MGHPVEKSTIERKARKRTANQASKSNDSGMRVANSSPVVLRCIRTVTPRDLLAGRQEEIHTERDRKVETARQLRKVRRLQAVRAVRPGIPIQQQLTWIPSG